MSEVTIHGPNNSQFTHEEKAFINRLKKPPLNLDNDDFGLLKYRYFEPSFVTTPKTLPKHLFIEMKIT